jgi:hypothetical protein
LKGEFAWLPDAPVLGVLPPGAAYWELLSPVERVRIRVHVLRDEAGVPMCLSAAREDDISDTFCPSGSDRGPTSAAGFEGTGGALGFSPGLLANLLETARRGHLTAPLILPP